MKAAIRWAISNTPAMNTLMVSALLVGALSLTQLRREEFPRFELELILVNVPYPGASPEEVENGICLKMEEAVRSIDGIKKVTSVAREGLASIVIEVKTEAPSVQKVLAEVESEIDRIPSLPELAEEPEIRQVTMRNSAIFVGIVGPEDTSREGELRLRNVTETVRDELLIIPQISVADIQGAREFQIDVEISESTLREYGLTLQDVARRIRWQNLELPGGNIRAESQEFLLRGKNKRVRGEEIAEIPLITTPEGVVLTVGDLGTVRDEFIDTTSISRINGRPGLAIAIKAADREDLLAMTEAVREYVDAKSLPAGYSFQLWGDSSINVNDRLQLLIKNGLQGLLLVFLVLALFLEIRLAFWVALGIPISVLGACAVLWQLDQTLNMLSMFSFLIALGIVVDDAIVIGENIYAHREQGKKYLQAAVDGTVEVLPSVVTSITSTVFAFMPMFFVTGVMGKFFAVLPIAMIAMLVISLLESSLVLPCHLAHGRAGEKSRTLTQRARHWRRGLRSPLLRWIVAPPFVLCAFLADHLFYPFRRAGTVFHWVSDGFGKLLEWLIEHTYQPALRLCLRWPGITMSGGVALLVASASLVTNGTTPWDFFPKLDSRLIQAQIVFPDGTPAHITDKATRRIEQALRSLNDRYQESDGIRPVELTYRQVGQVTGGSPGGNEDLTSGGHVGSIVAELLPSEARTMTSQQVIDDWRSAVGQVAGVEDLSFSAVAMGPGGKSIEFKLLANAEHMDELESAVEACKAKLASFAGVNDISDDSRPGKWEMQIQVRDSARAMGVPLQDVAGAVRAAYYGEEVMRLQRGRHEVKLMVRYPEEERRQLANFSELRVDTGDGVKRPVTELAEVKLERGYSEINRIEQKRSITISADVDDSVAVASDVVGAMQADFMPELLEEYPAVSVRWEGQQEQSQESVRSLMVGLGVALLATFVLLTLEFRSYMQPLIIMAVIPFGVIGALWGHAAMGLTLTIFSLLGLVALTGVVVNDSIVLVDFINSRVRGGVPLGTAILEAGRRRFRTVLLTSMTTIAGLLPILTERSFQAQILIPMANSICFGLLLSTALVLILVPVMYSLYGRVILGQPVVFTDETGSPGSPGGNGRASEETYEQDRQEEPSPALPSADWAPT
ncbi:MAG: AcrB/AcrD/AcrF family protein [Planctomycetota bacterium]|nr:MAG: AcrB/AcrD/AcrF family protein [Planctomycetota bacterium]